MNEVPAIGASRPPGVPDVRDFPADDVGEYPNGHVGHVRVFQVGGPVVPLEDFLVRLGHAVGDQHYRLVTTGANASHPHLLEQLEGVGEDHGKIGDSLGVHLRNAVFELAYVGQVRLDETVAETRHHL